MKYFIIMAATLAVQFSYQLEQDCPDWQMATHRSLFVGLGVFNCWMWDFVMKRAKP